MTYQYTTFDENNRVSNFFNGLDKEFFSNLHWRNQQGLNLYGYFHVDGSVNYLFIYGKTTLPDTLVAPSKGTIFESLKAYGSSKKYKGLMNIKGEVLLQNIYDDFSIFFQTPGFLYLKTKKKNRFGLVCYKGSGDNSVQEVIPAKYEDIFYAGEYTVGFVVNQKVGFMSLDGREIVKPIYRVGEDYNYFTEGRSLVHLDREGCIDIYINHYGNFVGYPELEGQCDVFAGSGTGFYPYGDLPDASDAYEGDPDALWNTD